MHTIRLKKSISWFIIRFDGFLQSALTQEQSGGYDEFHRCE
jgi:hypothetical protein